MAKLHNENGRRNNPRWTEPRSVGRGGVWENSSDNTNLVFNLLAQDEGGKKHIQQ